MEQFSEAVVRRFESKFRRPGPGACWCWIAGKYTSGYGAFSCEGIPETAHTFAYRLYVGPIPEGQVVRHSCDTPACVNPRHLLLGTQAQNVEDMYRRKRKAVKLSPEKIAYVKKNYRRISYHKSNAREIAAELGIDVSMVNMLVSGRYKHQYLS